MDEESKRNKSTDELRTEIARSRERVDCDLRGLHYELDFPAKLQRSYREETVSWLAAATVVGALMILLLTRKKKQELKRRLTKKERIKINRRSPNG